MSELRRRRAPFPPEGPLLTPAPADGDGSGGDDASDASSDGRPDVPLPSAAAPDADDAVLLTVAGAAFLLAIAAGLLLPSFVAALPGRALAMAGFFLAAAGVALGIFLPGGLAAHATVSVGGLCLGLGLMIGGIVGGTLQLRR